MEPAHPCDIPMPVPALGAEWRCPECGCGWMVVEYGYISGPHWERTSWTLPYVD